MITLRSNRIYKKDLDAETVNLITETIGEYNSIKRFAHKTYVNELRYPDGKDELSLFLKVKERYPDTYTYFTNSAISEAKAAYKSCAALLKDNRATLKAKQHKAEKKLKDNEKYLQKLLAVKNACVARSLGGRLSFPKRQRTFKILSDGSITVYEGKKHKLKCKFDNVTDFECQYLTPEIKKVKARIGLLQFKINKFQSKIDLYNNQGFDGKYIKSVCFGSRKLQKQARTDPKKRQEYQHQRNGSFTVMGRCDSKSGNFVFSYDDSLRLLSVKLKPKTQITLNIDFPYGQDIVRNYYKTQTETVAMFGKGKPITYTIEDLGAYYIVKCALETESEVTNYSKSDGVIGIDTNLGFFSVCETNTDGQPILLTNYRYEWHNKTSNQTNNNIYNMVKELIAYAKATHKPIVIEDLKFKGNSKIADYNSNKSKNFKSNMFAYHKMTEALKSAAQRNGIEVYAVEPQYTSLIGKEKFMPYYKRSIHQMAALAIARRCLELTETIPKRFTADDWKTVYSQTK